MRTLMIAYRIQINANDKPGSHALQLSGDAQFSFLAAAKGLTG